MTEQHYHRAISQDFGWTAAAFTDVGTVRKINEDDYMSNSPQAHWAVADGMGGHDKGDVASQSISVALKVLEQPAEFTHFVDNIEDSLIAVNQKLQDLAGDGDSLIGSTVAGLALHQQHALYYWAGDSRIYRLRNKKLSQLSIDHTFTQELVDQGKLSLDEVASHPNKNVITRAVGADYELFVDFEMTAIQADDLFFICSDGIEKEMSDEQVQALLNQHRDDLDVAGQQLMDTVLARNARDNVTFILVAIHPR